MDAKDCGEVQNMSIFTYRAPVLGENFTMDCGLF